MFLLNLYILNWNIRHWKYNTNNKKMQIFNYISVYKRSSVFQQGWTTPISHTLYLFERWLAYSLPLIFIQEKMAREPWNRVNIPFPSAVSSVRIPFNSTTGRVYCSKNIISFFMSLSAHKSRHLKPTWGSVGARSPLWVFGDCCRVEFVAVV